MAEPKVTYLVIAGTLDYDALQMTRAFGGRMVVGKECFRSPIPDEQDIVLMPRPLSVSLDAVLENMKLLPADYDSQQHSYLENLRRYKGIKH